MRKIIVCLEEKKIVNAKKQNNKKLQRIQCERKIFGSRNVSTSRTRAFMTAIQFNAVTADTKEC